MVPTAWQDEALARDGVSREVPFSALKGGKDPASILRPPKVPRHAGFPRGEHRGFSLHIPTKDRPWDFCQRAGDTWAPIAYLSKQLDMVTKGWPPCIQAMAAIAALVPEANKL